MTVKSEVNLIVIVLASNGSSRKKVNPRYFILEIVLFTLKLTQQ